MKYLIIVVLILLTIIFILYFSKLQTTNQSQWKLNTSNVGKLQEFQRLFKKHNTILTSTHFDLDEIEADPISVVAHKASQLDEGILIEDTSLEVEGADIGVNVRWMLDHLQEFAGKKATWTVLLAYRKGEDVHIYKGEVHGTIVIPTGEGGFGFDPVFLPDGASQTLAESKPDQVNARALAVDALLTKNRFAKVKAIFDWNGPWQQQ